MSTETVRPSAPKRVAVSHRAAALAERLEQGAQALISFAGTITDAE